VSQKQPTDRPPDMRRPAPPPVPPLVGAVIPWLVLRRGRVIDTVYFLPGCTADEIRSGLIGHDGYPADIGVQRRRL
jgi:hypothetical protein